MEMKIRNNKGEFNLRVWVVSFLIFMAIFSLLFLSSQSFLDSYGEGDLVDESYQDNYDQFNETAGGFRTLFTDMSDSSTGILDLVGVATIGVFKALMSVVQLTFASISILDDIVQQTFIDIGVPESIANIMFSLISAIIMILLIFVVISSINRGNPL